MQRPRGTERRTNLPTGGSTVEARKREPLLVASSLAAGGLLLAGAVVYANSLRGVFLFDDVHAIVNNPRIRQLWPPSLYLSTDRPVVELSLAVNYAFGELRTTGYHWVNLAAHLLAGLTLFGLVRRSRSFVAPPLVGGAEQGARHPQGVALHHSTGFAFAVALLWLVHPLQTESVTYVTQRAESMMGLFGLLTVYAFARTIGSRRPLGWYLLSIVACATAMGCKAVAITIPALVLLYDRCFVSGGFGKALARRGLFYAGLFTTWTVLAASGVIQQVLAPATDRTAIGLGFKGVSPWEYLLSQSEILLYYLRLSVFPSPLCLDYAWPAAHRLGDVALPGCLVLGMFGLTLWWLVRRPRVGFTAACFFLILAPTSSVIPVRDLAVEHRMYLPLAGVIALALFGLERLSEWAGQRLQLRNAWMTGVRATVVTAIAFALGGTTVRRNQDYHDELGMWRDVAAKRPNNPRARVNIGVLLERRGDVAGAIDAYHQAIALDGDYPDAYFNLGVALLRARRWDEAESAFRHTLRLSPNDPGAQLHLGDLLAAQRDFEGAATAYREGLKTLPRDAGFRERLCTTLRRLGQANEALAECNTAVRLAPTSPAVHEALAHVFIAQGDMARAIPEFQRVLELDPKNIDAAVNLGTCLKLEGRTEEAVQRYRSVLHLDPDLADAHFNLADALMSLGKTEEAVAEFEATIRLSPSDADTHVALGHALRSLGRAAEAAAQFQQALTINPAHREARAALESLLGVDTPK